LVTAASISVTRLGPELAASRCSARSSTHFTGRQVNFASIAVQEQTHRKIEETSISRGLLQRLGD